jgi:hypothetical protein
VQRAAVPPGRDLGVGASGFGERAILHDRDGAEQRRIEPLDAVEVDSRELRRGDLPLLEQRREPVRGQERDVRRVARHRTTPPRNRE